MCDEAFNVAMDHLQLYCSDSESCHSDSNEEECSGDGEHSSSSITPMTAPPDTPNFFGLLGLPEYDSSQRNSSEPSEADSCAAKEKAEKEMLANQLCSSGMEDALCAELPKSDFWNRTRVASIQPSKCLQSPRTSPSGQSFHCKRKQRSHPYPSNHNPSSSGRHLLPGSNDQQVLGSISQSNLADKRKIFFVHPKVANLLNCEGAKKTFVPSKVQVEVGGHSNAVNRVRWGVRQFSHLLLSASMDGEARVWNVWSKMDKCVQRLTHHHKAVRDAHWNAEGTKCLTCSYDRTAALCDVETGQCLSWYPHQAVVSCGHFHPAQHSLFLTGSVDLIQAWDVRQPGQPVRVYCYKDKLDMVQDVVFSRNGDQFFTSCGLVSRDSADRTLIAWDFSTGTVLSNQIFQERYSCSRLRLHPTHEEFLAQTQGGYIAIFSTQRPYKMNKAKRFQEHQVQDYSVGFDISGDGTLVASGSSSGGLYCYHFQSGRLWRKLDLGSAVFTDLAFHPVLPSTLATGSWEGRISLLA